MYAQARCHATPGLFHWLKGVAKKYGIQVLAAACLALNQRGEGSSPSGPTRIRSEGQANWRWHPARNGARPQTLEGSTPSPSADSRGTPGSVGNLADHSRSEREMLWVRVPPGPLFRGRLTAGRRALNPQVLARLQPPELGPGGERDIMAPSEGAGPGSIPGRGADSYPWSVAEARRSAKAEVMQVRLLPGILWPNPKRERDPVVTRGCVGSTPTGHPRKPAQLDRSSTALVRRRVWVRLPPLALLLRCSSKVERPAEDGRVLVQFQPPEL